MKMHKTLEPKTINWSDNFISTNLTQSYLMKESLTIFSRLRKHSFLNTLYNISLARIPAVEAASPKKVEAFENIPTKPPPMKYKDLPLEEFNVFYVYHKHFEDIKLCPDENMKLLHTYLYPIVSKWRAVLSESFFGMKNEFRDMKNEMCEFTCKKIRHFKEYMRHPNQKAIGSGVLVLGTATGVYIGSGTRGVTRKLFYGTLGALASGALCFPKESDELFRDVSFRITKAFLSAYNSFCGKRIRLRERLSCIHDLPPEIKLDSKPKKQQSKTKS